MERVEVSPGYESLAFALDAALTQAQAGKGKERHACSEPFEEQQICQFTRQDGLGFPIGQAKKKATESHRLPGERGENELLGAINYLAAAWLVRREQRLAGEAATASASESPAKESAPPKSSVVSMKVEVDTEEAAAAVRTLVEEVGGVANAIQALRGNLDTLRSPALTHADFQKKPRSFSYAPYEFLGGIQTDFEIRGVGPADAQRVHDFFAGLMTS